MILKVIRRFKDKDTPTIHEVGQSFAVEDLPRINNLVRRGLCEIVSCDDTPVKRAPKAKDKAKAGDNEASTDNMENEPAE